MDVAQILQGLSYMVCSTKLPTFFAIGSFYFSFWHTAIIQHQLVAMLQRHSRFLYSFETQFVCFYQYFMSNVMMNNNYQEHNCIVSQPS